MTETYYEVLGVPPDATGSEIEDAYRRKVRKYHPDVSDHPDAAERIKRVNRAGDVLTDTGERERYDRLGHEEYRRRRGFGVPSHDDEGGGSDAGEDADRSPADEGPASDGRTERGATGTRADGTARNRTGRRTGDESAGHGAFVGRELAAAAVVLALTAAAFAAAREYALLAAPTEPFSDGSVLVVVLWMPVAAVVGRLAAGGTDAFPSGVVRPYALPLALVAAVWWLGGTVPAIARRGAVFYGAFVALFRTMTLAASGRGNGSVVPAAAWFAGTAPFAVALYARLFGADAAWVVVRRATRTVLAVSGSIDAGVQFPPAVPLAVAGPYVASIACTVLLAAGRGED